MFVMKSLPILLIANFLYGFAISSANFGSSRSSPSKRNDRLPPLVPPKLVEDDEDFEERDLDLSPAHHVQLRPSYWAPTLETLAPEEAEFYRKALVGAMIGSRAQMKRGEAGRSMSMLRMGRSSAGGQDGVRRRSTMATDGVRRSMTMLRMGRAFDEEEEEEAEAGKRSMGMLRMGRGANEEDFRKSMSMLRMGRGATMDDDNEDHQQQQQQQHQLKRSMGMLRMGRRSLGSEEEEEDGTQEEESKRSMGMLRMGRASKNVDRGALNMLRMGKREAISSSDGQNGSGLAAADKSSSSSSSN